MLNNEILLNNIKNLCDKHNIKITNLEKELGFGAGIISRWGNNADPSLSKIVDIADYFQISLDEVVGYNQNTNDKFLQLLYDKTEDNSIKWELGRDLLQQGYHIKLWDKPLDEQVLIPDDYTQTIYATKFQKGYIIIYSYHHYEKVARPEELILFIQPSDESYLVDQHYDIEELKTLWTKILNSLGDNAPDSVKAEDLKNSFINEFSNTKPQNPKKIIFSSNLYDKQIEKLISVSGCLLYELKSGIVIDTNPATGITKTGKDFYYMHKKTFGKVTKAKLKNGKDLMLISDSYLMKLSGFTWGKEHGAHGFNGLLEVLNDAGFNVNQYTNFDGDDFNLFPSTK